MPRRNRAVAWAAVGAALAIARPVQAAVPLRWEAPGGCPTEAEVQAQLDALLHPSAWGRAQGEVVATGTGFRLTLVVETARGRTERSIEATTCDPLAQAAAVVVAVAVDPIEASTRTSAGQPPPSTASALSPTQQSNVPAAASAPAPAPDPARWRPRALTLGAEAGVGTGLLPAPHATVHAWGGLAWRRLEGHVTATHRFARLAERSDGVGGGGAVISSTTAGLRLGPVVRRGRWSVRLLAELEAGAMVAEGRGLRHPRTAVSPWLGVGLRPGVAWSPARWVALSADVTLTGSLLQPQFEIEGGPLIHRASLLGARIGLSVEFRVPLDQPARRRRPRG